MKLWIKAQERYKDIKKKIPAYKALDTTGIILKNQI